MKKKSVLFVFLALVLMFTQLPGLQTIYAASSTNENVQVTKSLNPSEILEGEETEVTLNVQGTPDSTFVKPNDIILIIDRSGSMAASYGPNNGEDKMKNAKDAAKGFIDLVDFSKHRIGIVDFASNVSYKDLSTNPTELKQYINGIQASGGTGTKAAIEKARDLLKNHREDAQPVIILLTDGQATEPSPDSYAREKALEQARIAKTEGVVFYTIALLLKNEDPNTSAPNLLMKEMATTAHHHHFVLGSVGLAEIYAAIVDEIGVASAYDVKVTDYISPEFEIVPDSYKDNIPQPVVSGNTISWNFLELKNELLTFKYKIRHKDGAKTGNLLAGDQPIEVQYKNYLGDSHQYTVTQPVVNVRNYAPIITSVEKDNGPVLGGDQVIIKGQYFRPNPTVEFGNTKLTAVQYVSSTELIVTAPAGAQGTVQIKVTNDDGQFASADYRYYADPVISSILPTRGPLQGGNEVVIQGNYFMPGAKVFFDGQEAENLSVTTTKVTVKAPASQEEKSVDVKLVNPDQTETSVPKAYTYVSSPTIVSLTPDTGPTTGGEKVILNGSKLLEGAKVYFDNKEVNTTYISSNSLELITPEWARNGAVKVKVINPDGQFAELSNGYTYVYPQPEITTVEPKLGSVFGGSLVKIKGNHFLNGAKVYFDSTALGQVSFVSTNEILVRIPAWTKGESVDVKVVNPDGQETSIADGFTYELPAPPTLTSLSPVEGPQSGGTVVTINGTDFRPGLKIFFGSTEVTASSLTDTKIVVTSPKWTKAEKVDIRVVDAYGQKSELPSAYEYLAPPPPPAPKISGVSPNSGPQAGGNLVSINGVNFVNGAKVYLGDTDVSSLSTFYNTTLIFVKMPKWGKAETLSIKVVNPDQQFDVFNDAYSYDPLPAPEITEVSPNKGLVTGGEIVTINGKNFVSGIKLQLDSKDVAVTFLSSTQLQFKTPSWSTEETVDVTVTNPDTQKAQLIQGYSFELPPPPPAPQITGITPNNGEQAGGTLVYINGANFINGAKIYLDNVAVATTFNNPTQLIARTPSWATAETVDVKVVNPDSQEAILSDAFTFNAPPKKPSPVVQSVTPNEGETTGGQVITLTGQNFESGTKVYFNQTLVASTFYNSTTIMIKTPQWTVAESVTVKVVNPDQQEAELNGGYTYILPPPPPAPVVDSVSPGEVPITGGTIVTITGKNFVKGATVKVGNTAVLVTFVSTTQLAIKTPVWSTPEDVDVIVQNPDGQIGRGTIKYVLGPPPTVTSVTPNTVLNTGGEIITLLGANFNATTKVYINDVDSLTTLYSPTDLKVKVPATTMVGTVDIRVVNVNDGQSTLLSGALTYKAPAPKPGPTITSVTPNNGAAAGGYIVTVYGTNFTSTSKVYVNNVLAPSTFYGPTQILIKVPASSVTGGVTIKVENPDNQYFELVDGFTYN